MNKIEALRRITETGIVPVVRAESADEAVGVVEAIAAGGIDVFEVTMTVPGALGAITRLIERFGGQAVIGAGSVLDAETARLCILAGAQFVVSPITDTRVIEMCRRYGVPVMAGALTPTEIVAAWAAGADMVKVFPVDAVGGARYLKVIRAPLGEIELIPPGGITLATAPDFIRAGAAAVGVGSELVDLKALRAGATEQITELARRFIAAVREAR